MTIARFENDVYQTQNYDDLAIEPGEEKELSLAKGAYRIITTQRQIDGGVSCIASSFVMSEIVYLSFVRHRQRLPKSVMRQSLVMRQYSR